MGAGRGRKGRKGHSIASLLLAMLMVCSCAKEERPSGLPPTPENVEEPAPAEEPLPRGPTPGPSDHIQRLPQSQEATEVGGQVRQEIKGRLWGSPLGQMFSQFVFGELDTTSELKQAHAIVERLFSQVTLTLTRLSALQFLVEDIYELNRMTSEVHERVSLLENTIALKRHAQEAAATAELFKQLPAFFLLGALGGSPLMRQQSVVASRYLFYRVLGALGFQRFAGRAAKTASELRLGRIFSRDLFRDYSFVKAGSIFVQTFGGYAVVFFQLRSGISDSASVQEKIWIYGLGNIVDLDRL